ncbi:MAG: amidohydrolase family protein [Planctomycetota bacterium]
MLDRREFNRLGAGALLWLAGCQKGDSSASADEETIVLRGGTVLPVDEAFSSHTAVAIRGTRVLAVGTDDAVTEAAGRGARVIDLDGRTVLPGFIEPHMHFAMKAGLGHFVDVGPFVHATFEDALEALGGLHEQAVAGGEDEWVRARQFDPSLLDPPRELTSRDLDAVAPSRPAFVLNASGHIAYVNGRALELAGLTKDTPDPPGASYGRYEDGSPNGILYGTASHLPVLMRDEGTARRMMTSFVEAGRGVGDEAAALGITTLCDMATGALSGAGELENYRAMYEGGRMKARIRAYLYDGGGPSFDEAEVRPEDGDALMRVAGWKVVTDGSNQGFTGRQRTPYFTEDTLGLFYVEPEDLRELVLRRSRQGWPLALHGNGDAAIDSILDAVTSARENGVDVEKLRIRIEHCSILHDEQIARMKDLGVLPSFLINHVHYWGHVMRDQVFGPEKVQLLDRCAAVESAGLRWVMHSDDPVSPLGSLHKIRVAVVRDLWKEPGTILAPDERVPVESAIRAVTRNAAWQCHSEHEIGSLEPGKLADLVVLEDDPRAVEATAISDIRVSETWMDGRRVFGG